MTSTLTPPDSESLLYSPPISTFKWQIVQAGIRQAQVVPPTARPFILFSSCWSFHSLLIREGRIIDLLISVSSDGIFNQCPGKFMLSSQDVLECIYTHADLPETMLWLQTNAFHLGGMKCHLQTEYAKEGMCGKLQ